MTYCPCSIAPLLYVLSVTSRTSGEYWILCDNRQAQQAVICYHWTKASLGEHYAINSIFGNMIMLTNKTDGTRLWSSWYLLNPDYGLFTMTEICAVVKLHSIYSTYLHRAALISWQGAFMQQPCLPRAICSSNNRNISSAILIDHFIPRWFASSHPNFTRCELLSCWYWSTCFSVVNWTVWFPRFSLEGNIPEY
jgi:hypothetical protein